MMSFHTLDKGFTVIVESITNIENIWCTIRDTGVENVMHVQTSCNIIFFVVAADGRYYCKCGRVYKQRRFLVYHLRHECGRTFQCHLCPKFYRCRNNLKVHLVSSHHEGKVNPFDESATLILPSASETYHQSKLCHFGVTKWICADMGLVIQRGTSARNMYRSMLVNSCTERRAFRFYCDCGRRFITASHLRSHQKHECGKTFPCSLCGKHFKTRKQIPTHIKTVHYDLINKAGSQLNYDRRYTCDACGRSYKNKRSLTSHEKIECGKNRRYFCQFCSKGFYYKSKLKHHVVLIKEDLRVTHVVGRIRTRGPCLRIRK
nr:zinc finger protein 35-like [Halyomorpha halys]